MHIAQQPTPPQYISNVVFFLSGFLFFYLVPCEKYLHINSILNSFWVHTPRRKERERERVGSHNSRYLGICIWNLNNPSRRYFEHFSRLLCGNEFHYIACGFRLKSLAYTHTHTGRDACVNRKRA